VGLERVRAKIGGVCYGVVNCRGAEAGEDNKMW